MVRQYLQFGQQHITLAVPEQRMKESLMYISMARKRLSMAYLDDSLLGVICFCLLGYVSSTEAV